MKTYLTILCFFFSLTVAGAQYFFNVYSSSEDDVMTDLIQTSDGGYVMAGYRTQISTGDESVYIIKTDAQGNLQWRNAYAGNGNDRAAGIIQLSDGSYWVAIQRGFRAPLTLSAGLIKLDENGNETQRIPSPQSSTASFNEGFIFIEDPSNGTFKVGSSDWIYTLSSAGQFIDSISIDIPLETINLPPSGQFFYNRSSHIQHIIPTISGGYLLAGSRVSSGPTFRGNDLFVKKIDDNGNEIWQRDFSFESENGQNIAAIKEAPDGRILVAYQNCTSGRFCSGNFARLQQFDSNGNFEWSGAACATNAIPVGRVNDIELNASGEWVLVGGCGNQLQISAFDFSGTEVNTMQIDRNSGQHLIVLPDGDFVVAGMQRKPGPDNLEVYLLRTAPFQTTGTDLAVSLSTATPNPSVYSNVTFQFSVTNQGAQTASGIKARLPVPSGLAFVGQQLSQGTYAHYGVGEWNISTLAAGQTATLELTLFTLTTDAVVLYAEITESNEPDPDSTPGNGDGQTASEDDEAVVIINGGTPPGGPDLDWLSFSVRSPLDLSRIGIDNILLYNGYELRNVGSERIFGEVPVKYYLSTDQQLDASDRLVADFIICCVNWRPQEGKVVDEQFFYWPPNVSVPAGDYFIIAKAFGPGDIDSANDLAVAPLQIINNQNPPNDGADLSLSMSVDNDQLSIYRNYQVTVNIANVGPDAASAVRVSIPIPDGAVAQGGNEYQASSGTYQAYGSQEWVIPTLASGQSASLQLNLFSLRNAPAIQVYAEVVASNQADPDSTPGNGNGQTSQEDDEASIQIGQGGPPNGDLPDLQVNQLNSPARGKRGDAIPFTFDLINSGPVTAAGSYTIAAYLSTDTQLSADDAPVGEVPTGNTPPGIINDVSGAVGVPNLAPGDYHLILVADVDDDILESNEQNNQVSIPFRVDPSVVSGGMDLELDLSATPVNPSLYSIFTVRATVSNTGSEEASGVEVYLPLPAPRGNVVFAGGNEYSASQGSFNPYLASAIWEVGTIAAGGDAMIELNYFVRADGNLEVYAEIKSANQTDVDSQPGNGIVGQVNEDDEAQLTISLAGSQAVAGVGYSRERKLSGPLTAVYPNPASHMIFLSDLVNVADGPVRIIDLQGRERIILEKKSREVDISALPAGVYFVTYWQGQRLFSHRFVKGRL